MHEGIEFRGIAYESEAPTLLKQLPNGGVDCQDEKILLDDARWKVCELLLTGTFLLAG